MGANMLQEQLSEGLWNWYPYGSEADIVKIESEEELKEYRAQSKCFDFILMSGLLEKSDAPVQLLQDCRRLLKKQGHLLIGAENRLGLAKFCGDRDPYTNRIADGIEGYHNFTMRDIHLYGGRCYAKYELAQMLDKSGFYSYRFFSVLPGLLMPQQIYDEDYMPKEELAIRFSPVYHTPQTVYLNEGLLYTSLIRNGMFHQMANAYLIDCSMDGKFSGISHVTTSMDRGEENAQATIIYQNGTVVKKALYPSGKKQIKMLWENTVNLAQKGISVVKLEKKVGDTEVIMPYMKMESALTYLRNLIFEDAIAFTRKTEYFLDLILASSNEVKDATRISSAYQELGKIYEQVYLDMVPLNAFYENGEFIFYDQEFAVTNYPVGVALIRALDILYMGDKSMEAIVPEKYFLDKYDLSDKVVVFRNMGAQFIKELRNEDALEKFRNAHWASPQQIFENKERIQYTRMEYERLFLQLESDLGKKTLYIFGSGLWARKFVAEFSDKYQIRNMLDNQKAKWGTMVDGVMVASPEILKQESNDTCKVIICVKYDTSIIMQLKKLGITNIGIYDPGIDRDRELGRYEKTKQAPWTNSKKNQEKESDTDIQKRYHVGYIAGVFDLFHKGHLNLLRRAKEQCEYLLVGIVSDEQAIKNKKRSPYVCEQDRKEIVEACRYVDQAFILPYAASGTRDVYKKYHFDVQFSGSDYEHDSYWLGEQAWLRESGADLVFFPYTQSVSSTKLKKKMDDKSI